MKNFNYKCKKCEAINSINPNWFRGSEDKKIHVCTGCGNKIQLNTQKIRQDIYNDFKTATEVVFGKKPSINELYVKINVNEVHKRLIKLEEETIIIGRGNELGSQTESDNEGQKTQRIIIPDKFISSRHCRLKLNPKTQKVTIQDLGSLNKTFMEEKELNPDDELILKLGSKIKMGITTIELC
ncbi:MAG: FHA domain-containing protein [Moheibacter sp.]